MRHGSAHLLQTAIKARQNNGQNINSKSEQLDAARTLPGPDLTCKNPNGHCLWVSSYCQPRASFISLVISSTISWASPAVRASKSYLLVSFARRIKRRISFECLLLTLQRKMSANANEFVLALESIIVLPVSAGMLCSISPSNTSTLALLCENDVTLLLVT